MLTATILRIKLSRFLKAIRLKLSAVIRSDKMNYENIFDAHAHYDDKWFDDDRFELLDNIKNKGVCGIVNNSVDLKTAQKSIEYAEKYDFVYAAVGFHPENLDNMPQIGRAHV